MVGGPLHYYARVLRGFTVGILGVFMMEGPKETWANSVPPVSPAVMGKIVLSATFFLVYLVVALWKTAVEVSGTSQFLEKLGQNFDMFVVWSNFEDSELAGLLTASHINDERKPLQLLRAVRVR